MQGPGGCFEALLSDAAGVVGFEGLDVPQRLAHQLTSWLAEADELGTPVGGVGADFAARATSPLSLIALHRLGGAISRVDPTATAFPHRNAAWHFLAQATWPSPQDDREPHVEWARQLWAAMRRFSSGGAYVNHLLDEGQDRVREAYGTEVYDRLVALKDRYDPDNVFHLNQNIRALPRRSETDVSHQARLTTVSGRAS